MCGVSGKKLNDVYFRAWESGMKSTYYYRTLGASQIEKSTLGSEFGFTQKREYLQTTAADLPTNAAPVEMQQTATVTQEVEDKAMMCSILNGPDCESCQ